MAKSKTIIAFPDDYVVIDTETTGLDCEYDSIIEISGIKYKNNKKVDKFTTLVKPRDYYVADEDEEDLKGYIKVNDEYVCYVDSFITRLTGITNEMLVDAPFIEEVLPDFLEFIGDYSVIGHNVNFDIRFLNHAIADENNYIKNNIIDTMRISRLISPEFQHHRLKDLIKRFDIQGKRAHRAEADCEYNAECYLKLKDLAIDKYGGIEEFIQSIKKKRCKGAYSGYKDITTQNLMFNEEGPIYGNVFVFTGTLEKMKRKEAMQLVVDLGGETGDRVTNKTNYLVLGNNDYNPILRGAKSSKQKKAEAMKLEGKAISVISENVFYNMVEESKLEECEEIDTYICWQDQVKESLNKLIVELELPEQSLYLDINYKRGTEEVNSYSICLYEPEYPLLPKVIREPSRNAIVMNIKDGEEMEAILDITEYGDVEKEKHKTKIIKSDPQKIHVFFKKDDGEFIEFVERHIRYGVANYTSKASSFGCCSRFIECSDAKKCVHENKLYSKACLYRMHLDAGEIFYGENKNI